MANDGKVGIAPCGHVGRAVIGQYYQCDMCDKHAVPEFVVPECTVPFCAQCGSEDVTIWPGMMADGRNLWFCRTCTKSFFD